jgi:type VI secretion system protein ImpH
LVRRLLQDGYRFDVYQAVHVVSLLLPRTDGADALDGWRDASVQLRPSAALAFPASDIERVDAVALGESRRVRITATFGGLYGVDAALPAHYHDLLATEATEGAALRDFLDIFNHRLYALLFRAWQKYRPVLRRPECSVAASPAAASPAAASPAARDARRFLALAGIGPAQETASLNPLRLASFAGRLGVQVRSAEGLAALLDGLLGGLPVTVEENVPRWVPAPDRPGLAAGVRLGANATIGRRVRDCSGAFRIHLGPLPLRTYLDLLPGGALARHVDSLVRRYAPDYLDYDVALTLETDAAPPTSLGAGTRLGLSTFLGRPSASTTRIVRYPGPDEESTREAEAA